ncbi:MAG TPA: glutathione S-transferase [Polyangiales bacterium]|nr:glutathione S-transferase [Polyangiales bacterium]
MANLTIWGRITSINVRKVVWVARELGLEFQHVKAGREFGVVNTPEYLRMNPNAKVPVIDDGGFVLWESNVIVRYLCAKHSNGALCPSPLRERFEAERWMDWQQTTLNPAGRDAFWQLIRTPAAARDESVLAKSVAATEPLLSMLDSLLATRRFIAGEGFTMADIPIACEVHRFWSLPRDHAPHPQLERWYDQVSTRPATRGVLDVPLA